MIRRKEALDGVTVKGNINFNYSKLSDLKLPKHNII